MAKLTKRMRVIREKVDATKQYDINEAIALLKELATAKFVESVDVAVNLGIDARKSDQNRTWCNCTAARYWPFRSRSRIYPRCKR